MAATFAEITAEVGTILGGGITAESAEVLRRKVVAVCANGGLGDPLSTDAAVRDVGKNWLIIAVSNLITRRWYLPAKALLYELWDAYAELQRVKNRRVYRALISQLLTEVCHAAGDRGEAYSWALLTQADDILGAHGAGGGHGRHWLYGVFGLSAEERTLIDTTAAACRAEAGSQGWNTAAGFAEDVLRQCVKSG